MKATWKKIWKPDGSTVELKDGKPEPEFTCIMLPPRPREDSLLPQFEAMYEALATFHKPPAGLRDIGEIP